MALPLCLGETWTKVPCRWDGLDHPEFGEWKGDRQLTAVTIRPASNPPTMVNPRFLVSAETTPAVITAAIVGQMDF